MATEIVDPLFFGPAYKTSVWVSERVQERIEKYRRKQRHAALAYFNDIEYYAANGFELFVGDARPVRPKWKGVFGIDPGGTLFRLYGFQLDNWSEFIVLGSTLKGGQKMRPADRAEVDRVASVRKEKNWEKSNK